MKIVLEGDDRIRLEGGPEPLTIEADSAERVYSPFHMLGSALATCTYSVLHSWAEQARLDTAGMAVAVEWEFAEEPHRVGRMKVELAWPGLPEQRRAAAERVIAICAVHQTLHHPPEMAIEVLA